MTLTWCVDLKTYTQKSFPPWTWPAATSHVACAKPSKTKHPICYPRSNSELPMAHRTKPFVGSREPSKSFRNVDLPENNLHITTSFTIPRSCQARLHIPISSRLPYLLHWAPQSPLVSHNPRQSPGSAPAKKTLKQKKRQLVSSRQCAVVCNVAIHTSHGLVEYSVRRVAETCLDHRDAWGTSLINRAMRMAGDHRRSISSSGRLLSLGSITAKICSFAIFYQWLSFNVVQLLVVPCQWDYVIQGVNTCTLEQTPPKIEEIAESKMGTGRRQCRCCWKFKLQVGVVVICSQLQRILWIAYVSWNSLFWIPENSLVTPSLKFCDCVLWLLHKLQYIEAEPSI